MLYRIAHFLNRPLSGDFSFQTQLIAALRSGLVVFGVMLLFTGSQVTTDRPAWFVPGRKFRYHDIMVAPIDDNEDTHVVHNAVLTVEVTSENSSGVDHDTKFHEYIGMPSVECCAM